MKLNIIVKSIQAYCIRAITCPFAPAILIHLNKTFLVDHCSYGPYQDLERGFTNTRESLESINARGTTLVDGCRDELTRESGRSSLAELNDVWSECLAAIAERKEVLRKALELAEKYQVRFQSEKERGCV